MKVAIKLMVRVVFYDPKGTENADSDLAAEELSKAGYTVHQKSPTYVDADYIEAVILAPDDNKIADAVYDEVQNITHRYGGYCWDGVYMVDGGYIPFERVGYRADFFGKTQST